MALVPLFEPKGSDAYLYPLTRDGATRRAGPGHHGRVLLCDTYWLSGCGGDGRDGLAANARGPGLTRSIVRGRSGPHPHCLPARAMRARTRTSPILVAGSRALLQSTNPVLRSLAPRSAKFEPSPQSLRAVPERRT